MDTNQVRYFVVLCEEQSITRTAKRCGVTQPSVTNAIRRLEVEFGGVLFHRTRRGTKLSPYGVAVRPYLTRINQSVDGAARTAANWTTGRGSRRSRAVPILKSAIGLSR